MAKESPKKATIPVRMSPEMQQKIAYASEQTGLAQADIIRLCAAMGLEDLRRINYDISGTLSRAGNEPHLTVLNKVADEEQKYRGK